MDGRDGGHCNSKLDDPNGINGGPNGTNSRKKKKKRRHRFDSLFLLNHIDLLDYLNKGRISMLPPTVDMQIDLVTRRNAP